MHTNKNKLGEAKIRTFYVFQALKYENFSDVGCLSDESEDDGDGSADSIDDQRRETTDMERRNVVVKGRIEMNSYSQSNSDMTIENSLTDSNLEETIANAQLEDSKTGKTTIDQRESEYSRGSNNNQPNLITFKI